MTLIFRMFSILLSVAGFFVSITFIGGQHRMLKNPAELIWMVAILFFGWLLFGSLAIARYLDKKEDQ